MEREEIIEGYVKYMKIAARLDDDILRKAISDVIDEEPDLLNKIEAIISKKEKIFPIALGEKRGYDEEGDIVRIFGDISESLITADIALELTNMGYSTPYRSIHRAITEDLLYVDDIETDGTIYLALTDKGEALWELIHF